MTLAKLLLPALLAPVLVLPAKGADLTFVLDKIITGDAGVTGSPVATIDNVAGGTAVVLTMNLLNMSTSSTEYDKTWWFNLRPAIDPQSLTFQFDSSSTGAKATSIATGANAQTTPGQGGVFDLAFNFGTTNKTGGAFRFDGGEFVRYTISRAGGLVASDFNVANGAGFLSAAKINGLAGGGSVTLGAAVPEPGLISLLGVSMAGVLIWVKKRRDASS